MLLHVRGVDKARIIGRYGVLSEEAMQEVDEALRIAIGLTKA
jgi:mRNA-degrading endonuclease toxin of MazEF toxin-antitoxin module